MICLEQTTSFIFITNVTLYLFARHKQESKSILNNEVIGLWSVLLSPKTFHQGEGI